MSIYHLFVCLFVYLLMCVCVYVRVYMWEGHACAHVETIEGSVICLYLSLAAFFFGGGSLQEPRSLLFSDRLEVSQPMILFSLPTQS